MIAGWSRCQKVSWGWLGCGSSTSPVTARAGGWHICRRGCGRW
jgi:hypothetical protein